MSSSLAQPTRSRPLERIVRPLARAEGDRHRQRSRIQGRLLLEASGGCLRRNDRNRAEQPTKLGRLARGPKAWRALKGVPRRRVVGAAEERKPAGMNLEKLFCGLTLELSGGGRNA